jgi:hypothetical protein
VLGTFSKVRLLLRRKGCSDFASLGLMAMNHVGWAHRDVSASNCLLSCDPADGPSVVLDMELAQKTENQASASKTAISVSGFISK